jgi:neopullulanase
MFPSRVAEYNDNRLVGTEATTAQANFDRKHPLYREIGALAKLRNEHAALRSGKQLIRNYEEAPGLFAYSRIDPSNGSEILIVLNTSTSPIQRSVEVSAVSTTFTSLHGECAPQPDAPGSYRVAIDALSYVICQAH